MSADGRELRLDLGGGPVQLHEQHRRRALRVAAVHRGLGRLDGQRVHHLDRGGHDPGGDDVGDRAPARLERVVGGEHQVHRLGRGGQLDDDLGDDAERAFRAGERAEQVVAGRRARAVAEPGQLAGGRDDLQPEHVVDGEPVLEAVRAAGVLRDVPAYRADDLTGRVGRVEQPVRRGGLRHRQVRHAGLDDRAPRHRVDLKHAPHPRHHDQHALGVRHRAAGQAGAAAARHERHAGPRADPHDGGDLGRGLGQHDERGHGAVRGQPVALVGPQLKRVGEHVGRAADLPHGGGERHGPRGAFDCGVGHRPSYGMRSYAGSVRNSAKESASATSVNSATA